LVSAATHQHVGAQYDWRTVEPMSIRGKSEPMALFAPLKKSLHRV
jgi:class 3 adenylate cyclase